MAERPRIGWSLGIFAITPCVAFAPFFVRGEIFLYRDLFHFIIPAQAINASAYRALRLPEWNPFLFSGLPHLANPGNGALYPFNWTSAFLSPTSSVMFYAWAHFVLAGLGVFFLALSLGAERRGALWAGLTYQGSGYLISMHCEHHYLGGAALLPWGIWALLRCARRPGKRTALHAALLIAALFFNGEWQAAVGAVLLGWLYALGQARTTALLHSVAALGAASLGGVVLAASQILPALSFAATTTRARGLSQAMAEHFSLDAARWPELLWPGYFGRAFPENSTWGGAIFGEVTPPLVSSLAVSIVALLCLALGAGRRIGRGGGRWNVTLSVALVVIAVLLALGPATPVWPWCFANVPLFDRFRYPEKYWVFATLGVALLVGASAAGLRAMSLRRWLAVGAATTGLAAVALVHLGSDALAANVQRGLAMASSTVDAAEVLAQLGGALVLTLALAGATLATLYRGGLSKGPDLTTALLLPALLIADTLLRLAPGLSFGVSPPLTELPPVLREVADPGALKISRDAACRAQLLPALDPDADATRLERQRQRDWLTGASNLWSLYGVRDTLGYEAAVLDDKLTVFRHVGAVDGPRARRLFGSTHLVRCSEGRVWLEPEANPLPRAYVGRAIPVDADKALGALSDPGFDFVTQALVLQAVPQPDTPRGEVHVVDVSAEEVHLEVRGSGGLVVLNDTWADGWSATVDGVETPILLANLLYRGVVIPPGEHRVVMRYAVPMF